MPTGLRQNVENTNIIFYFIFANYLFIHLAMFTRNQRCLNSQQPPPPKPQF